VTTKDSFPVSDLSTLQKHTMDSQASVTVLKAEDGHSCTMTILIRQALDESISTSYIRAVSSEPQRSIFPRLPEIGGLSMVMRLTGKFHYNTSPLT
jgi:hypothetical protein